MYRKQMITVSIVILSLMFAVIAPAMAQDSTATPQPAAQAPQPTAAPLTASTEFFATTNFRVNVRSGPGTQYTILGKTQLSDGLDITGRLANNQWLRVNFNGQEGWVSAALVDVTGDVATAPESVAGATAVLRQTANQTVTTQLGNVSVVTRVNANLRKTPAVAGEVLATIPFGTQLEVTGRNANSNWVQVNFNNQNGWISSGLLEFQLGNIVNVNILDENGNVVQPEPAAQATVAPTTAP
jgi:uncharacterized protein YraI